MKKLLLYSVSLITCLYFLSAGNISLFSKFKKNCVTEFADMDEDSTDKDGKTETDDSKENKYDEENFLNQNNFLLPIKIHSSFDMLFPDKDISLSKPLLEISSPPPKA